MYNEHVTNILLGALLLLGAVGLALGLLAVARVKAEFGLIKASFLDFVTPETPGQPSQLAKAIDAASVMAGRAVVAQAKSSLMGLQSGETRGKAAVEGDVAEGQLSMAAPALGGLLNSFPILKKSLRQNPGLLDYALPFLTEKFGNRAGPAPSNGNGSSGSSPKFNL